MTLLDGMKMKQTKTYVPKPQGDIVRRSATEIYLGFAEEPRLKKAAHNAIDQYGLGTGYRTLAGTHALHVELEERIAAFKG